MNKKEKEMDDVLDNEEVVDAIEVPVENEPRAETRRAETRVPPPSTPDEELAPLFEEVDAEKFHSRWLDIQSTFVDDPREAVRRADTLVDEVITTVTQTFAHKRTALENQWKSGEDASTEDLRLAIKRYRSFFNRLLSLQS